MFNGFFESYLGGCCSSNGFHETDTSWSNYGDTVLITYQQTSMELVVGSTSQRWMITPFRGMSKKLVRENPAEGMVKIKGSDHCPFFSKPRSLHKILIEIAQIP